MSQKRTILFVSHEASRTGAPIVLLHFLKWLKQNTSINFVVLLRKEGELLNEFKAIAPTYLYSFRYPKLKGLKGKILGNWNTYIGIPFHYRKLKATLEAQSIELIYCNSVSNGEICEFLSSLKCPIITHVHEMDWVSFYHNVDSIKLIINSSISIVAASNAVKEHLVSRYDVSADFVTVIHEFIPVFTPLETEQSYLYQELNIPIDAFTIGISGTMDMRKGFDLLVLLAKELYKQEPCGKFYFLWIGGDKKSEYYFIVNRDAEKTGMAKFIRMPGAKENPQPYFSLFDVTVLLSREDPFPLVCLETALLGKPIICFDQSGGMPELIEEDSGFIIPYLDIASMAEKIIVLYNNPVVKEQMGVKAKKKVIEKYNVVYNAPRLMEIINQQIKQSI